MEGHNAGVNWCSFHPRDNLIVSASDDKRIKLWKFSDTRCWEYDSYSGHTVLYNINK
jgi:coatomer protein complex subunit alpha (xenin)